MPLSLPDCGSAPLMSRRLEGDPDAKMLKWVAFMHRGELRLCGPIQLMSPSCYIHEHKEAIKQDCATVESRKLNFAEYQGGYSLHQSFC